MRTSTWLSLALAATAQAQTTVTFCESYSYTATSTFYEYTTYYVDAQGNTIRPSSTSLTTQTLPPASSSTSSSFTSTLPGNGTSILIPDGTVTPPSSTMTTTTRSMLTTTTPARMTITASDPRATDGDFFIDFNAPTTRRLLRKRTIKYFAFDNEAESILVDDEADAATFQLVDGVLKSGGLFVAYDSAAQPPRFSLQATVPASPVDITIGADGQVIVTGVDEFCVIGTDTLVVVADGQEAPTECQAVKPEIVTASDDSASPTSTMLTTSSSAMSSSSSAMTTTTRNSSSVTVSLPTSSTSLVESSTSSTSSLPTTTDSTSSFSSMSMSTSSPSSSSSSLATTTTTTSSSTSDTTSSVSSSTSSTPTSTAASSATTTSSSTSLSSTTTTSTTTSSSAGPVVTDQAYIDTVLRHHNAHRANHTVGTITWNADLAATAKKIADTCVYAHNITADCPPDADGNFYSCYGQNIGAGYTSLQMGLLISDGFYNGEVNYYTYYGGEPDTSTLHEWGHFSQIVWKDQASVGCYTTDCTNNPGGLGNIDPSTGIQPYFTVCNYDPPGNYIGEFADNVLTPLGEPSIHAGYLCPTDENCEDGALVGVAAGIA